MNEKLYVISYIIRVHAYAYIQLGLDVSIEDCTLGPNESNKDALHFDEKEPGGSYKLNLARIFDRFCLFFFFFLEEARHTLQVPVLYLVTLKLMVSVDDRVVMRTLVRLALETKGGFKESSMTMDGKKFKLPPLCVDFQCPIKGLLSFTYNSYSSSLITANNKGKPCRKPTTVVSSIC